MIQVTSPLRLIVFALILLAIASGLVFAFTIPGADLQQSGQLEIESGDSAKVVWQKLVDSSLAASTLPWRYHAWRQGAAASLKAGIYQLERGEKVADVVRRLAAGDISPSELTVTYPEGFTIEQMAERTAARGLGTKQEFLAAADGLEGYLFPDTYRFDQDATANEVVEKMRANFDRRLDQAGLTVAEDTVVMASIIEREVITDEDMALVSGVLWKRFNEDIGLAADATIRYALNKWDAPLTVQDLDIDSPYNTRRFRGLPPTPISNPGLRALQAAANPEESEYYYYLSAPSGETIFSRTNDEHNLNKAIHLR